MLEMRARVDFPRSIIGDWSKLETLEKKERTTLSNPKTRPMARIKGVFSPIYKFFLVSFQ